MTKTKNRGAARKLVKGKLHALLLGNLKNHVNADGDSLVIAKIANDLKVKRQTVYLWLDTDFIMPEIGRALCELPGSELVLEDVIPFFFKA